VIIALASSAIAYTYTCEEGRFTIDVPDDAEVSAPYESFLLSEYLSGTSSIDARCIDVDGPDWQLHVAWSKNQKDFQYFSLEEYYNGYLKNATPPLAINKYMTHAEASSMNVDKGFVIRSNPDNYCTSVFVRGRKVFDLSGTWGDDTSMQKVVRILNSFRALD